MSLPATQFSSARTTLQPPREVESSTHEKYHSAQQPLPASSAASLDSHKMDQDITYPEGGRDGWLVVLGAFCGLTASLGIYNTTGVFSAVIQQQILPEVPPSTLGWIFSVYGFVNWVCGVQVGPSFDAYGPRALILAGTVCTLVGIFTLSVSTGKFCTILFHSTHLLTAV